MAESYYFNRTTRRFIRSLDQPVPIDPPIWVVGDVKSIEVTFVDQVANSVSVVTASLSAQLAIGTPGSSPATSATSSGATNNAYAFTVPLNTAAISSLAGSAKVATTLEFRLSDATGPNRYKATIYVEPYLISDSLTDVAPPEVALGRSEAAGIYVAKEPAAGTRMVWTDEVTGQRYSVGFANGQFVAELL